MRCTGWCRPGRARPAGDPHRRRAVGGPPVRRPARVLAPRIGELPVRHGGGGAAVRRRVRRGRAARGRARGRAAAPGAADGVEGCAALAGAELGTVEASFCDRLPRGDARQPFYLLELVHAFAADALALRRDGPHAGPDTIARGGAQPRLPPLARGGRPRAGAGGAQRRDRAAPRRRPRRADGRGGGHGGRRARARPGDRRRARAGVRATDRPCGDPGRPDGRRAHRAQRRCRAAPRRRAARRGARAPAICSRPSRPAIRRSSPRCARERGPRLARGAGEIAVRCLRRALEEPPEAGRACRRPARAGGRRARRRRPGGPRALEEALAAAGDARASAGSRRSRTGGRSWPPAGSPTPLRSSTTRPPRSRTTTSWCPSCAPSSPALRCWRPRRRTRGARPHGGRRRRARAHRPCGRGPPRDARNLSWWLALQGADARRAGELAERAPWPTACSCTPRDVCAPLHYAANVLVAAPTASTRPAQVLDAALEEGAPLGLGDRLRASPRRTRSLLAFRFGRLEDAEAEARPRSTPPACTAGSRACPWRRPSSSTR